MSQPDFDFSQPVPRFSGPDLERADRLRLAKQLIAVRDYMADGSWRSLREIEQATGHPQASVSARLRQLRNDARMTVERRRRSQGTWEYRVIVVEA